MAHTKGKSKSGVIPNPFEAIADAGDKLVASRVAKSLGDDLLKEGGRTFIDQLLGLDHTAGKGEQTKKVEVQLGVVEKVVFNLFDHLSAKGEPKQESPAPKRQEAQPEKPKPRIEAAMNYHAEIAKRSEKAAKGEKQQMNRDAQEIMMELKKLIESSKMLKSDFAQFAVEETPTEVGKYHVHFLKWMRIMIRQAQQKVEQSGAWLQTVKGKNTKGKVKSMFDKGGETQRQNMDRTAATQTG